MATIENFEDIVVWQKARELDKEIFLLMKLYSQTKEISKLLSGFIKYLKESDMKGEKFKKALTLNFEP